MTQERRDGELISCRRVVDGVPRSVEKASLAALHDLGLDDTQIAKYFAVEPIQVEARREHFGLGEPS